MNTDFTWAAENIQPIISRAHNKDQGHSKEGKTLFYEGKKKI